MLGSQCCSVPLRLGLKALQSALTVDKQQRIHSLGHNLLSSRSATAMSPQLLQSCGGLLLEFSVRCASVTSGRFYLRTRPAACYAGRKSGAISARQVRGDSTRKLCWVTESVLVLQDVLQGDGETDSDWEQSLSSKAWVEDKCHLLRSIERTTDSARCAWDTSLEESLSALEGSKYLLAAHFDDDPPLLPHLFVQLWHTLALLPLGSSFVSMYHNGSSAETGKGGLFVTIKMHWSLF